VLIAAGTSAAEPTAMAAVFTVQRLVRFSDCDPAGMVFYPQYFVMLNSLVEDWFTQALGVEYAHFLGERRLGLPMASLQCDFKSPSRMGETIALSLQLLRMGRRSLTLGVKCCGATSPDDLRWSAKAVIVTTSLAHDGSIPIPQDVVQGIADWQNLSGDIT
jgi:4-hydroxybenzoyl-CoA thioesterase